MLNIVNVTNFYHYTGRRWRDRACADGEAPRRLDRFFPLRWGAVGAIVPRGGTIIVAPGKRAFRCGQPGVSRGLPLHFRAIGAA